MARNYFLKSSFNIQISIITRLVSYKCVCLLFAVWVWVRRDRTHGSLHEFPFEICIYCRLLSISFIVIQKFLF